MIAAVVLSVLVGLLLGLLGGGGSLLMIPVLVYGLHLEPRSAIATSLLVVGVTSLVAAIGHARRGQVRVQTGLWFGLSGMLGAAFGGRLSHELSASLLLTGFSLLALAAGASLLRPRPVELEVPAGELKPVRAVLYGVSVGFLTGLLGAGGGFLVVPALHLFGGLPMRAAIGTSLMVIALSALGGFAVHASQQTLNLGLAFGITLSASLASLVGGMLASKVSALHLRRGFGWFVLATALLVFVRQWP